MPELTALISVSDKTRVLAFAQALHGLGVKLLTGGTAKLLADNGLPVTEVAQMTGFPEMLDGRVKTLHPRVHGGLLARRDLPAHMAALEEHGIATIDLLVVNLYPFEATVAQPGCTLDDAIENIDIGGPAMVRSAAKNWKDVAVLTDASQYETVLQELTHDKTVSHATRFALAVAAFNRISNYDAAISDYLSSLDAEGRRSEFPAQSNGRFVKLQDLRYGENPHQAAAFYRDLHPAPGSLVTARQLQGKELSYNNIADADAAWECVKGFEGPACVIVKHANPCGVAIGADAAEAYAKAFKTDPTSAYGGIIAFNTTVDEAAARHVAKQFVEVLIAPAYTEAARAVFAAKANARVLEIPLDGVDRHAASAWQQGRNRHDIKRIGSGILIQSADNRETTRAELIIATKLHPTEAQMNDLLFAWKVAKYVKSNAIVFCAGGMTLGVGAGQMSRVDSARIAGIKAANAGLSLSGSAVASDAFFPFRDGLDVVIDAGASCVIQPGGSMRDDEVIAAADERGIAMVLTGVISATELAAGGCATVADGHSSTSGRQGTRVIRQEIAGFVMATLARLITGAQGHWVAQRPKAEQRIYFANHQSHFDWVLIWCTLPRDLRASTRPIAARDYWTSSPFKHWLTREVFNAVYVSRVRTRYEDPLEPLIEALRNGDSLVIFPEGTRGNKSEPQAFKSGLYHLAEQFPEVPLIPAWIDNVQRVMPKGEVVPVPILCSVTFGAPLQLAAAEDKRVFLARARAAVIALRSPAR